MPASARGGLSRTRAEARAIAADGPLVAVAARYDATRGTLTPQGPVAQAVAGGWAAPAIVHESGRLGFFAAIPAALVRVVPPAETRAEAGALRVIPRPHRAPIRRGPTPSAPRRESAHEATTGRPRGPTRA